MTKNLSCKTSKLRATALIERIIETIRNTGGVSIGMTLSVHPQID